MFKSFIVTLFALFAATLGGATGDSRNALPPAAQAPHTQTAAVAAAITNTATPDTTSMYAVQPGDTISGIAEKFNIPQSDIRAINNLKRTSLLKVGQKLQVPTTPHVQDLSSSGSSATQNTPAQIPNKKHTPRTLTPVSLAASAALALGATPEADALSATNAVATNGSYPAQSRSPPDGEADAASNETQPAPAGNASAFVTQDQFNLLTGIVGNIAALLPSLHGSDEQAVVADGYGIAVSQPLGGGAPNTIAAGNAINQLTGTTLTNITVNGVAGLAAADIPALPYLPLSGGTLSGTLALTGAISVPSLSATSTSATSTFAGGLAVSGYTALATTTITGGLTIAGNTNITQGGELTVGDKVIAPGEIGLGTTTPGAKLAVQSTIASQTGFLLYGASGQTAPLMDLYNFSGTNLFRLSAAGDATIAGMLAVSGTTTLATTTITGGLTVNGNTNITSGGELTVGDKVIAPGEIGIGTSTPEGKLAVQGTLAAEPTLLLYGAPSQTAPLIDAYTDTGTSLLRLTAGGLFGIGTLTPSYALDVAGLGHFTGLVDAANFVATSSTATSLLNGNLTVNGNTTLTNATSTNFFSTTASSTNLFAQTASLGSLTLASALGVGSGGTGATNFGQGWIYSNGGTGALAASTSPTVNYITATSSTVASQFPYASTTAVTASGTGFFGLGNFTQPSGTTTIASGQGFTVGGSQFVVQQGSGNVGIGTASPAALLAVNGTFNVANTSTFNQQATFNNANIVANGITSQAANFQINRANNGASVELLGGNSGDLKLDTNGNILLNAASGANVGIGTTTPDSKLSIYASTKPALEFSAGTAGPQWTEGIDTSNGDDFEIASSTALGTNPRFVITGAGNVGIGTTNPGSKLEVQGNASFQTFTATSTTGTSTIASGQGFTIGSSQFVVQQGSGNVGIGTNAPTAPLNIVGTGNLNIFTLQNTSSGSIYQDISNTGGHVQFGIFNTSGNTPLSSGQLASAGFLSTVGATALQFGTNNITRETIDSSGNVGIGTSTPGSLLTVASNSGTPGSPTLLLADTAANNNQNTLEIDRSGVNMDAGLLFNSSNGSEKWDFGMLAANNTNNIYLRDVTNSTNIISIDNGAAANSLVLRNTNAPGTIGIATSTPWGQLSVTGRGTGTGYTFVTANSSNVPTFVVQDNGNVGIGTTSPVSLLTLGGTGAVGLLATYGDQGNNTYYSSFGAGAGSIGRAYFGYDPTFGATVQGTGAHGIAFNVNANSFGSGQAMVITNTGNVGIGTTTPLAKLDVAGSNNATAPLFQLSSVASFATTTEFIVNNNGNATLTGCLNYNGGTSGTCLSDERVKQDINPFTDGLNEIIALNPVTYEYNGLAGTPNDGNVRTGLIAQQVQGVAPDLVATTSALLNPTDTAPTELLEVNYSALTFTLINAVKEIASITGDFQSNLIAWLGNANNGIQDLFANNIYATNGNFTTLTASQKLCIGSTCITEAQLDAVLAAIGQTGTTPSSSGEGSGNSGDQATSSPDTPPVIQINGDNPATIQVGATYQDLGATIEGPTADLNLGITTYLNGTLSNPLTVDTSQPATDTISYVATDQSGLTATSTRTVIIEAASSTSP